MKKELEEGTWIWKMEKEHVDKALRKELGEGTRRRTFENELGATLHEGT